MQGTIRCDTQIFAQHHPKPVKNHEMNVEERINKVRDDLNRTQCQRKLAQTNHENVINEYQRRIHVLERKVAQAFRTPHLHVYMDEIRSDNKQTPYVVQRQAIMCSILHQLQFTDAQTALMEIQHEENFEIMMKSVHDIDNDWAIRTNKLTLEIANTTEEIARLESLLTENRNKASKLRSLAEHDESVIDCTTTHHEPHHFGLLTLLHCREGKTLEKKEEWMTQFQRSLPGFSSMFDLRPKDSQLHKLMAESA